jgi:hypothetical protein
VNLEWAMSVTTVPSRHFVRCRRREAGAPRRYVGRGCGTGNDRFTKREEKRPTGYTGIWRPALYRTTSLRVCEPAVLAGRARAKRGLRNILNNTLIAVPGYFC